MLALALGAFELLDAESVAGQLLQAVRVFAFPAALSAGVVSDARPCLSAASVRLAARSTQFSATASKSVSNKSAYTSNVMAALR
jgi:hypothetical protein